ncbi:hypothetical protein RRG08_025697 [Elysia crispata]|uniref:Uncharacterized protein n=1 Tax=Elysia crispata TaxID=231223 RepID=A0AAE1E644_9GAST|nr:hypothetical protein RRG08_025697 [Elysia crispata]
MGRNRNRRRQSEKTKTERHEVCYHGLCTDIAQSLVNFPTVLYTIAVHLWSSFIRGSYGLSSDGPMNGMFKGFVFYDLIISTCFALYDQAENTGGSVVEG